MVDKVFYFSIAGFVGGVFVRSFVATGAGFAWLFVLLGAALFILPISFSKGSTRVREWRGISPNKGSTPTLRRRRGVTPSVLDDSATSLVREDTTLGPWPPPLLRGNFSIVLTAVFMLAFGLGVLRYDFADSDKAKTALGSYVGESVTLEGIIRDEPDVREKVTRLIISLSDSDKGQTLSLENGLTLKSSGAKILITTDKAPEYLYGDRLLVRGKLERPENFQDETTLRETDYVSHLAKDGIYYEMFLPKIEILARGEGNRLVEKLLVFKNAFIENINTLIPQPHAALLAGLVVGAKQSLGKELLDDFRTVGVIHIVVLSGYNITIIARFIEWLLSGLRRNIRLVLAALAIILFATMVGAGATVVRATIMALLVLLAHGTGRLYAVTRALLIAGVIMLLHNPKILVFDVSFQLSFLATVGLIYVSPIIEPKVKWITERWRMREIFVATVATQLFVLPFLLYKTGILSLVSLPVNLLILAAVPATMLMGFLAGMAGFVSVALAAPFAFLSYALLAYELGVVEWFARLPFAAIALALFPAWLALFCYAAYGVVIWRLRPQSSVQLRSN
ncbi:MAG: ComEC/Rec2 family competence protein [Patescibacteria group bacterium]